MDTLTSTITPKLASRIEKATASLLSVHLVEPQNGETFASPQEALERLQNWAFTQGFAVVIESSRPSYVRFQCIHYKKKT